MEKETRRRSRLRTQNDGSLSDFLSRFGRQCRELKKTGFTGEDFKRMMLNGTFIVFPGERVYDHFC